jgi:hypothetical protein
MLFAADHLPQERRVWRCTTGTGVALAEKPLFRCALVREGLLDAPIRQLVLLDPRG